MDLKYNLKSKKAVMAAYTFTHLTANAQNIIQNFN